MLRLAREKARLFAAAEAGVSAIEFALISGIFFALVFGIIIYGDYFATGLLITNIAQESARASLAGLDDSERESLALARANALVSSFSGLIKAGSVEITAAPSATAGVFEVKVTYDNDFLGLATLSSFVPLPPTTQTADFRVSNGGYKAGTTVREKTRAHWTGRSQYSSTPYQSPQPFVPCDPRREMMLSGRVKVLSLCQSRCCLHKAILDTKL